MCVKAARCCLGELSSSELGACRRARGRQGGSKRHDDAGNGTVGSEWVQWNCRFDRRAAKL